MTISDWPPLVTTVVSVDGEPTLVEAFIQGRPSRVDGKPRKVEVLMYSGRHTLAPFDKTSAINDAARVLLETPVPGRAAKA